MINVRGGAFNIYPFAPLICNTDILFILRRFIMANVVSSFLVILSSVLSSLGLVLPPDLRELLNLFWLAAENQPEKIPAMLLRGLPGAGKTSVAEAFALAAGAVKFFYQCVPSTGKDEMLGQPNLAAVLKNDSRRAIADGILIQAAKAAIGGENVVLIIDELDKASPETDAYLLDFLQSRRIRDTNNELLVIPVEVKVWVFFTSNADRDLSDALMRRVRRVTAERPDRDLVAQILGINEDAALLDIYEATEKLAISQLKDYMADGGDPYDISWLILSQYCDKEDIDLDKIRSSEDLPREITETIRAEEIPEPSPVVGMWWEFDITDFSSPSVLDGFEFEPNHRYLSEVEVKTSTLTELMWLLAHLKVCDDHTPSVRACSWRDDRSGGTIGLIIDYLNPVVVSRAGAIYQICPNLTVIAARQKQNGKIVDFIPLENLTGERWDTRLIQGVIEHVIPKYRESEFRAKQAQKLKEARQEASVGQASHLLKRLGLDDLL